MILLEIIIPHAYPHYEKQHAWARVNALCAILSVSQSQGPHGRLPQVLHRVRHVFNFFVCMYICMYVLYKTPTGMNPVTGSVSTIKCKMTYMITKQHEHTVTHINKIKNKIKINKNGTLDYIP